MKEIILLCITIICIASFKLQSEDEIQTKTFINLTSNEVISPGRGYSSDRQQLSPIVCFQTNVSPYGKTESIVRLDQGSTFHELQNTLKVDVSTKIGIGIFSIEAGVEYLKYIKDTEYSMSINYYQFVQSQVTMEMGYGPAGALTMDGLRAYGSVDNPNPRFGLICGDMFINSYKVGAQLLFSIKLQFSTHTQKDSFSTKFGVGFGSFGSISTDIQRTITQTNSSGSMTILAYQSGGNPAELSKILNSTCGSSYCAATCSMQRLTDCNSAINGLLKYAISNFPSQVSVQDLRTLSSFPIGFAKVQSIKWIGLNLPQTYVTKDVLNMRQKLANITFENQYYSNQMTILTKSKLPLVKQSNLFKQILSVGDLTKYNLDLLMNQNEGGISCYDDPQSCITNGNSLLNKLKPINQAAIQNIIHALKYKLKITLCDITFYRVGDGASTSDWYTQTKSAVCPSFKTNVFQLTQQIHLLYNITATYQNQLHNFTTYNVNSKDMDSSFTGTQIHDWPGNRQTYSLTLPRIVSEYSFAPYQ